MVLPQCIWMFHSHSLKNSGDKLTWYGFCNWINFEINFRAFDLLLKPKKKRKKNFPAMKKTAVWREDRLSTPNGRQHWIIIFFSPLWTKKDKYSKFNSWFSEDFWYRILFRQANSGSHNPNVLAAQYVDTIVSLAWTNSRSMLLFFKS